MKSKYSKFAQAYPGQLYIYHVVFPLVVGGIIYSCYRTTSLRMFSWYQAVGIDDFVLLMRATVAHFKIALPDWTIYSLPNGLWVYSLTAFMLLVWRRSRTPRMSMIWPHIGLALGLGSEALQFTGTLSGAFDFVDVWLCLASYLLAFGMLGRSARISTNFNSFKTMAEVENENP